MQRDDSFREARMPCENVYRYKKNLDIASNSVILCEEWLCLYLISSVNYLL